MKDKFDGKSGYFALLVKLDEIENLVGRGDPDMTQWILEERRDLGLYDDPVIR